MIMIEAFGTSTPTSITVVETRIASSPEANAAMTRSLSLPASRAMHQADTIAEAGAKLGVARFRRGDIEQLRLGDQRADPIDLRAAVDGARDAGDDFVEPFERNGAGCDRLPSRRLFVEPRYIHVAIAREQQRARDRRRGHHQKLGARACALGLEREPLMHAEAMLLVDDDQAEVFEGDLLLEQRVRADQDVDVARLERVEDLGALASALAAREQRNAQASRRAEAADGLKMLARQQFGRRHQCRLRAGLDRRRHGEERHDRLAAADIALEQAQHAAGAREIGVDLGERAGLRAREREGQGGEDRFAQLSRRGKPPSGASLEPGADHGKRKLVGEKLVISEPRPRRRRREEVGLGCGRMQPRERLARRRATHSAQESRASIHSGRAGICASASPTALRSVVLVSPAVSG